MSKAQLTAPPVIVPELIYTVPDICNLIGMGRNNAYKIINSGEIATFKVGRLRKIRGQAMLDWIEKQENNRQ